MSNEVLSNIRDFHGACQAVIRAADKALPGQLILYARNYAKAGLGMTDRDMIACQCDYILVNLTSWRGDEAKATKAVLKRLAEV